MLMHVLSSAAQFNAGMFLLAAASDYGMYIAMILLAAAAVSIVCVFGAKLTLGALGVRFIPNDRVGIVEKLWSGRGSIAEGHILAFNGEAGFEARVLRGGVHFGKWS